MTPTVFLLMLAGTVPVAHAVGVLVSRQARVDPGHSREAMPALPAKPRLAGSAEQRWDRTIDSLERKLISRFAGGVDGVEAWELAAELGEEPLVVEATLARMREEIPCRMRITRSGKIFHDFEGSDIAKLGAIRTSSLVTRVLLSGLASMANIGAAWPAMCVAGVAMFALYEMSILETEDAMIEAGITGVVVVSALVIGTFVMGWIVRMIFHPPGGPRLADIEEGEALPQRHVTNTSNNADIVLWALADSSHSRYNSYSSSSWVGSPDVAVSSGGWDLDFDIDTDDAGEGILVVILVVILIAIIAAALSLVFIWARGIWRAIGRLNEPPPTISPAIWVRTTHAVDKWERFIPTNDLVVRTIHALRRFFSHRSPPDEDLAARVLILARQHGGTVTALQIMLAEGLDRDSASEVGSRLCGLLGGQIQVTDAGDLAFAFKPPMLQSISGDLDEDMWAEYIDYVGLEMQRRPGQIYTSVPVNIVGITKTHLDSTSRLVAGTYIMSACAIVFFTEFLSNAGAHPTLGALASLGAVGMALGAASLGTAVRYSAREASIQGIRRDIRRAVFYRVALMISQRQGIVDLRPLPQLIVETMKPSWRWLSEDLIAAEIRGAVIDLELEPSTEPEHAGQEVYTLANLYERLSAKVDEPVFDEVMLGIDSVEQDEVVFDTQIQHDHVTALGF